jgi:hypothetical protein
MGCFGTHCVAEQECRPALMDVFQRGGESSQIVKPEGIRAILPKDPAVGNGEWRVEVNKIAAAYPLECFLEIATAQGGACQRVGSVEQMLQGGESAGAAMGKRNVELSASVGAV